MVDVLSIQRWRSPNGCTIELHFRPNVYWKVVLVDKQLKVLSEWRYTYFQGEYASMQCEAIVQCTGAKPVVANKQRKAKAA